MKRHTISLRSGTWEWSVVDPDDPRRRYSSRRSSARVSPWVPDPDGAPPLPRRRVELRSTSDVRHRMCVGVPPHLGHAGDDAAVTMLAHNPDRRVVVGRDGTVWALWPEDRDPASPGVAGRRRVHALRQGERPRTLLLPEGLALGQLTDGEILDLLG